MVCLYLKDVSLIFGPCPKQVRAVVDSGQSHASSIIALLVSDECWGVHVPPKSAIGTLPQALVSPLAARSCQSGPGFFTVIARVWLTPWLCSPEIRMMAAGRP